MMNVLTQEDVKEIKNRIESISCPFCGESCQIELYLKNDVVIPGTRRICCDKRESSLFQELGNEISRQMDLKMNRFPG
jgi:hypothetical protein